MSAQQKSGWLIIGRIYTVEYITENEIDKNAYGFIYITTNMINGKMYIGQKRFINDWRYYLGSGTLLKMAIKKYNKVNFDRNIIAIGKTKTELNDLEWNYIDLFDAVESAKWYNIADGGYSNPYSGKTDEEMSDIRKNMSVAQCKINHSGVNNHMYGKNHTDDSKLKMKINHADFSGSNHPRAISIILINSHEVFLTAMEAGKKYNVSRSSITACCRGRLKSAGKHPETGEKLVWMYYEGLTENGW